MSAKDAATRALIEQYVARDPKAATYLELYDLVTRCGDQPGACAKQEAQQQLAMYLSNKTGVPVADVLLCMNDPRRCAEQQAIMYLASETGVSPEAIALAAQCARSGDSERCAKAGLILAATAACAAYTSGAGTLVCSKAAPMLVNYAWPHIKVVINIATFGMGLDRAVHILTFGQGFRFLTGPIGAVTSLLTGPPKGEFNTSAKRDVFWQAVKVTQQSVNSAIVGLWEGMLATRQAQGLGAPYGDAAAMKWAAGRWQAYHAERARLAAAVASTKPKSAFDVANMVKNVQAQLDQRWFELLAPPWPVPDPSQMTPQLAAREAFVQGFYDKLHTLGFNDPASRTSDNGKIVRLTGGHWAAWNYSNVCTNCTQNDVQVFADMVLKLFVDRRISRIGPAVVHFVDLFARDMAAETQPLPMVIPIAGKTALVQLPASFAPKPKADISFLHKFDKPAAAIDISAARRQLPASSSIARAWNWAKENPEYALPAAAVGLAVIALVADRLMGEGGFLPNVDWRQGPVRTCPCGGPNVILGYEPDEFHTPKVYCGRCYERVPQGDIEVELEEADAGPPSERIPGWVRVRGTEASALRHFRPVSPQARTTKRCRRVGVSLDVLHQMGCHPARPKCKWMREIQRHKYGKCTCEMYKHPHRRGSKCCRLGIPHGIDIEEYMNEPPPSSDVPF